MTLANAMNFQRSRLGLTAALSAGVLSLASLPTQAVQLSDGTVHFVQPPRLLGATATHKSTYFPGSTYYFTLSLPQTAGESLQRVVIVQEPSPDRVRFDPRRTEAFIGNNDRGTRVPLENVTVDPKTYAVTVTFGPSIDPGQTITIGLYAIRNPDISGAYLYGVTAFPTGEKAYGQFLGYGRIQIYGDRLFRRWF